jgi:hypothetical protein
MVLMRVPGRNNEIVMFEYNAPAIIASGGLWDSFSLKFPM